MHDQFQELANWLRDFAKMNPSARCGVTPQWWLDAASLVERAREDKARLDWLDMRDRVTWTAAEKDPMDMRLTPIRDAIDFRRTP